MKTLRSRVVFFLVFLNYSLVLAQQITLTGQVSIHNSLYRTTQIEYVKGAYATATSTAPDETDTFGIFQLKFVGKATGTCVKITVEKVSKEVVNARDLLDVVVGRITPVKVFLAEKGQLAKAQAELLDISVKTLTTKHDELIARLKKEGGDREALIVELEAQLGREFENVYEVEKFLTKQLEEAKQRLPETVKELAAVNLDFASEQYVKAYQLYEKGEVEKALAILDEQQLAKNGDDASASLERITVDMEQYLAAREKVEERVTQIVKSYRLKAESYSLLFQYRKAVDVFKKAISLLENTKKKEDMELADAYGAIGALYRDMGHYLKSKYYKSKNVKICESLLDPVAHELIDVRRALVEVLKDLEDYKDAIEILSQVLKVNQEKFGVISCEAGRDYGDIGSMYYSIKDFSSAKAFFYKQKEAYQHCLGKSDKSIIYIDMQIAKSCLSLGEHNESKNILEKAITIAEQNGEVENYFIAILFQLLAVVYDRIGDDSTSRHLLEKGKSLIANDSLDMMITQLALLQFGDIKGAIDALENKMLNQSNDEEYDTLSQATNYLNLATLKMDTNKEDALKNFRMAETLYNSILDSNDFSSAGIYNLFYNFLMNVEDYVGAKIYVEKSLNLNRKKIGEERKETLIDYSNLATVSKKLNELKLAKECFEKVAFSNVKNLGQFHSETALSFLNLSETLFELGNLDSAEVYLAKALEVFKEKEKGDIFHLTSLNLLKEICLKRGQNFLLNSQFELALVDFNKALDVLFEYTEMMIQKFIVNSNENETSALLFSSAGIYYQIGICNYYLGLYESAIENYEKAFKTNPNDEITYLHNKGMAQIKAGNLKEAQICFQKFEEIAPKSSFSYLNWAVFNSIIGKSEIALDNLEKAVQFGYNDVKLIESEDAFIPLHSEERYIIMINKLKSL